MKKNNNSAALILAVETSGRYGSVAIALGDKLLAQKNFSAPMKHSAEIFPAIMELSNNAASSARDIDEIYISNGPGSFTGLRIAVTLAKMMNLACDVKIAAVDTLDVIAANITEAKEDKAIEEIENFAAVLDAKRGEFFIAVYEKKADRWQRLRKAELITSEKFKNEFCADKTIWLLGEGLLYYKDRFTAENIRILDEKYWLPTAAMVHRLGLKKAKQGLYADPLTLEPAYMRKVEIGKKKKKRSAEPRQ